VTADHAWLTAALIATGRMLKSSDRAPSWLIPHVLLVFGATAGYFAFGETVRAAADGIMCAASAVFGHQIVKQSLDHDTAH
jgi:hypothetical protein